MKKIIVLTLLLCVPLATVPSLKAAGSLQQKRPSAKAWLVIDQASGQILRHNNSRLKLPIASTTKLLTALAVVRNGHLDSWVTISAKAANQVPSKAGLRVGEKWRRRDLLKALLIKSANDSATALAESVSGGEAAFCRKLNALAKQLGCRHSNIRRASGLPASGQYSTAADLAIILKKAMSESYIKTILSWKSVKVRSKKGRVLSFYSKNKFLNRSSSVVKGKTGYTRRAKLCFAGSMEISNKKYSVVFLGSNNLWSDLGLLRSWTVKFENSIRFNESRLTKVQKIKWQKYLNKKGLSAGSADGIWGPKTQKAFLKFQKSKKLTEDGLVGPQAWKSMS